VTALPDAAAALAKVESTANTWDLLITDQTMPGMTGTQLVSAVRRCRPDLPVILCTGYSNGLTPKTAKNLGAARLMTKPFGVNDMARAIREVLDAPAK